MIDKTDIRMALVAVTYYQRAHVLSKRPIPPAADRLAARLTAMLAADGQEPVVRQQDWLTTREVAARLKCSQRHARRIAAQVGHRVGRQWLTPEENI